MKTLIGLVIYKNSGVLILFSVLVLFCLLGCGTLLYDKGVVIEGYGEVRSIKASARLKIKEADGSELKGRAVIMAQLPDNFRIELLGIFNQIVFIITSDGDTLYLLSLKDRTLYKWSIENSPYPFVGNGLAAYLVGFLPEGIESSQSGADVVVLRTKEGLIESVSMGGSGDSDLNVKMGNYKTVSNKAIPYSISFEDEDVSMSITYENVALNRKMDSTNFRLTAPHGFVTVHGFNERP